MTVGEVKTIAPLAEVYESDPTKKYLFILPAGEDSIRFIRSLKGLVAVGSSVITARDPQAMIVRTTDSESS